MQSGTKISMQGCFSISRLAIVSKVIQSCVPHAVSSGPLCARDAVVDTTLPVTVPATLVVSVVLVALYSFLTGEWHFTVG